MQQVTRILRQQIEANIQPQKVMLIYGARRVGKTVLLHDIINNFQGKTLVINGESSDTIRMLADKSIQNYRNIFSGIELLAIDEAQHIPDIGMKLKLMVDEVPNLAIIATGSSSFDLQNHAGEPLVGRCTRFMLTPISFRERANHTTMYEAITDINTTVVYGGYPELLSISDYTRKSQYLTEIVDSYLLRDILMFDGLKNSHKLHDLLRLIAYQIGSEVSIDELGRQLGLSRNTVERYLDLLEKVFVLFRIGGYSKNLRKEITKSSKWYFVDNGIRNAVINDFRAFTDRSKEEQGALWESFIVSERLKRKFNNRLPQNLYFWRTYDNQEIDLLEDDGQTLAAFEMKSGKKHPKAPKTFREAYPDATYTVVNKDNFTEWL